MHEGSLVRTVVLQAAPKSLGGRRTVSRTVLADAPQYRLVDKLAEMTNCKTRMESNA